MLRKLCICAWVFVNCYAYELNLPKYSHDEELNQTHLHEFADEFVSADRKEQVAIVNEWADEILLNLNNLVKLKGLDPIELPGFNSSFKWTIFTGHTILEDGILDGLSSIQRIKDVRLVYKYPNVRITMPLSFSNLQFKYHYEMKFMDLGPAGFATGSAKGTKYTIELSIDMTTLRAKLDKFTLNTLGKVTIKFSGNGIADWIVNMMVASVIPMLKWTLSLTIEGYVVQGLLHMLDFYNNIICTILGDCPKYF